MTVRFVEGLCIANRFTLARRIGTDLAEELWSAEDSTSGQQVIIRLLDPTATKVTEELLARSIAEVAPLVHPFLLRACYRDAAEDGRLFIVSESRPHLNPVPWQPAFYKEQIRLLLTVLDALEYAHQLGHAHGRIDASTILADNAGNGYLSEFGLGAFLAARSRAEGSTGASGAGHPPGPADDIHALGKLLYRSVTGREFDRGSGQGVDLARDSGAPIARPLAMLIERMLSPAPYDRPDSIAEIRAILTDQIEPESARLAQIGRFARAGEQTADVPGAGGTTRRVGAPISRRETQVMPAATATVLFLLLIVVLGAVVLLLPSMLDHDEPAREVRFDNPAVAPPAQREETAATDRQPAPLERAKVEHLREQGNKLAAEFLRQQIYLEDSGARLWAPDRYKEAGEDGERADGLFREQKYDEALDQFTQGIAILVDLKASMPTVLVQSLAAGSKALEQGDRDAAVQAFNVAKAIDPDNADAEAGLRRAATLEQVLTLLHKAEADESGGRFEAALAGMQKIVGIDPAMATAGEGVKRLRRKIVQRDFGNAMTRGLDALAGKKYDAARTAFREAQKIQPDATGPRDGLEQIDLALRLEQIESHREKAARFRDEEAWHDAAREYGAALDLDQGLVFASEGKALAERRAALADRLQRFLDHPELITDADNYDLAAKLYQEAGQIAERGPVLTQQLAGLANLMKLAKVPMQVEITSDSLTDVTVYRVGQLGRIDSTTLTLNPGTYRIVGTRRGYRDQSLEFTLVPGQKPPVIHVSCTEKI